ncbi:TY-Chap domain-containing protein [Gordonia sp. DT219]|uniref:TY-Chap domain-containing protein n=1 Tax=Gordonia sp. DT219 TaxID=3416658 RepID=UPI003CF5E728
MRTNDFDTSVDDGWQNFEAVLAAHLRDFADGATAWIAQDPTIHEGLHGRVDFAFTGAHRVRATLHPATLDPTVEHYLLQVEQLRALGWRRLAGGTYIAERGRARADEIASIAAGTFRHVWDAVHPTFLVTSFLPSLTHVKVPFVDACHLTHDGVTHYQ